MATTWAIPNHLSSNRYVYSLVFVVHQKDVFGLEVGMYEFEVMQD